jgi:hypothetical protein
MANADLTAERLRQFLAYDSETGVFTRLLLGRGRHKPVTAPPGVVAGCLGVGGYIYIKVGRTGYKAHRLAWLYVHGSWPKHSIDHINGDRADNRIANLRDVNNMTNAENRRGVNAMNLLGYAGVSRHGARFRARLTVNKKTLRLGDFDTPEEAHAVYLAAKRELHPGCTI